MPFRSSRFDRVTELVAGWGRGGTSPSRQGGRFVAVNCGVGVMLGAVAWIRGIRPGLGTVVQPVVVGLTIFRLAGRVRDAAAPRREARADGRRHARAGYLGSGMGAGPTEAAALAWDPPVPFRWSYSILQGGGALLGWLLGAAVGPGTLRVIFLLGPAVDLVARRLPTLDTRVHADQSQL